MLKRSCSVRNTHDNSAYGAFEISIGKRSRHTYKHMSDQRTYLTVIEAGQSFFICRFWFEVSSLIRMETWLECGSDMQPLIIRPILLHITLELLYVLSPLI
jgi:hypothetical protein